MRRKVYFRADAGSETGYGHFIRSLALADILKDDFECTFFTCNPTEYQIREASSVCPLVSLPSGETALRMFVDMLDGDEIVVLDNYFYDRQYQESVKSKGCVLVCMDDLHRHIFAADLVISPFVSNPSLYEFTSKEAMLALGLDRAILRRPFLGRTGRGARKFDWTVCFGGSDPYGLTGKYARKILDSCPEASVAAVVGDGCSQASFPEGVTVFHRLDAVEMASLLKDTTRTVCSASTVCCEALACGSEVYAGYYVDNQADSYKTFVEGGYVHPLGDLRPDTEFVPAAGSVLRPLSFDGLVQRYRSLFRGLSMDIVNYVDMTEDMSRKVWEARNEESVRICMTNPEPFGFESHSSFIDRLRSDSSRLYFAFFDGERFAGSYDFTGLNGGECAGRGLYVSSEYRRQGIASAMEAAMECLIVRRGVRTLEAEVFKTNEKSISFHRAMGYEIYAGDDRYYYMRRNIL